MTIPAARAAAGSIRAARPPRQGIARHGRLPVTSVSASIGKFAGLTAIVLTLAGLILGGIAYAKLMGGITQIPDDPLAGPLAAIGGTPGGVNILLVGSDDRAGQGAEFGEGTAEGDGRLNDVNMVIHIAQDLTHAEVVSIPRDTIIDAPACTNDKGTAIAAQESVPVNSVLEDGDMSCVTKTIESITGLDIHYSAMVKFRGVIAMSNAVGGVPVCVQDAIQDDYVGLDLEPGVHTLQGEDALKFLRSRHGTGDGSDLARISNQQVFLSSLIRTIKSSDTLTDPTKLYGLAYAVTQNMALSQSMNNIPTLASFASAVASIPTERISFISLPVTESMDWSGKVEPLEPDATALWTMLKEDRSFAAEVPAEATPTTAVAPGADGSAGEAPAGDPSAATDPAQAPADPAATPTPTVGANVQHLNADQETCANS